MYRPWTTEQMQYRRRPAGKQTRIHIQSELQKNELRYTGVTKKNCSAAEAVTALAATTANYLLNSLMSLHQQTLLIYKPTHCLKPMVSTF